MQELPHSQNVYILSSSVQFPLRNVREARICQIMIRLHGAAGDWQYLPSLAVELSGLAMAASVFCASCCMYDGPALLWSAVVVISPCRYVSL